MSPRSRAALLLLLVTTFTAGCTGAMGSGLRPSATTTTTIIGWESRFRLDWTVQARAGGNDIEGYMYSQHGTPVTHVRLLAQGLDATGNVGHSSFSSQELTGFIDASIASNFPSARPTT